MTEIADARVRLHDQLVAYSADLLPPERVHLYAPTIVASPCLWIEQLGTEIQMQGSISARVRVAPFGVYILPDGYEPAQYAFLDEMVARVSNAVQALREATDAGSSPQLIDIGGTSVRGLVHRLTMNVFVEALCAGPGPPPPPARQFVLTTA